MVKELTFTENGQTKTIQLSKKAIKFLEANKVAAGDIDSVVGHDELIIVYAEPSHKWAEMIDTAKAAGILDSYGHLDKHVVIKNM